MRGNYVKSLEELHYYINEKNVWDHSVNVDTV